MIVLLVCFYFTAGRTQTSDPLTFSTANPVGTSSPSHESDKSQEQVVEGNCMLF